VPVGLHDELGVPHAEVGAEAGGGLVLGPIHPDLLAAALPRFQRDPAAFGAAQVAARETAVHAAVFEEILREEFAGDLSRPRVRAQLVVIDRKRLKFVLVHEGDQARASLPVHLERLRIHVVDNLAQQGPRPFHLAPVGRAVRVVALRKFRQYDDAAQLLLHHDRAESRPPGLFRPEQPLGAVGGLGGIEVVAVDAAVGRAGRTDPRGKEGDVLPVVSGRDKPPRDFLFQVEDVVARRRFHEGYLPAEAVDDQHDLPRGLPRDLQGVESHVLEIGAEVPAEIRDAGDARQRRQGDGHALAGPGKLRNAPERAR